MDPEYSGQPDTKASMSINEFCVRAHLPLYMTRRPINPAERHRIMDGPTELGIIVAGAYVDQEFNSEKTLRALNGHLDEITDGILRDRLKSLLTNPAENIYAAARDETAVEIKSTPKKQDRKTMSSIMAEFNGGKEYRIEPRFFGSQQITPEYLNRIKVQFEPHLLYVRAIKQVEQMTLAQDTVLAIRDNLN